MRTLANSSPRGIFSIEDHRVKSTNPLGFLICQLLTNVSECVQLPEQQECICCTWTYSYEDEYILVDEENILGSSTVPIPGQIPSLNAVKNMPQPGIRQSSPTWSQICGPLVVLAFLRPFILSHHYSSQRIGL